MKTLISIIAFLFIALPLVADCVSDWTSVYPKGREIYQNSKIVITGAGLTVDIIRGLDEAYPIYLLCRGELSSNDDKIRLVKKVFISGQAGVSQAVFEPERELIPNNCYYLMVDNLGDQTTTSLENEGYGVGAYQDKFWIVVDRRDCTPPVVLKEPEFRSGETIHYGCGTSVGSEFDIVVDDWDDSDVFVMTELTQISTGETFTYLLTLSENKLYVGKGMCGGAFLYRQGDYKVRFKIYDICGNTSDKWTTWIEHESPLSFYPNILNQ